MVSAHLNFSTVIELGLKLPDVHESAHFGAQALKLNGRMLACTPVNKSAEVNSAVVALSFEQRSALLNKHPLLYYITDHYAPHQSMLIRLSRVSRMELEQTLRMSWDFVSSATLRSYGRSMPATQNPRKPRSRRTPSGKPKS
jgi:hypothetical protein